MKVAEAFVQVLRSVGVSTFFGLPGSTEAALLEAVRDDGELRYVLALHEGVAVSMADGYARATGRPGLVGLHTSVGTMNGLSQVFNALRDGSPVVVTAGHKDRAVLAEGAFCAVADLASLARPVTKWAHQSLRSRDVASDLSRAIHLAVQPPAGPTYLTVPEDLMREEVEGPRPAELPGGSVLAAGPAPDVVRAAAELLLSARRPVLLAGSRARRALGALRAASEELELPVFLAPFTDLADLPYPTTDGRALGLYGEDDSLLEGVDVVLAVGCRVFYAFSEVARPRLPPGARLVHAHDDPDEIGRVNRADVGLLGDPRLSLDALVGEVRRRGGISGHQREERCRHRDDLRRRRGEAVRAELARSDPDAVPMGVERVAEALGAVLPTGAILVDEGVRSSRTLLRHLPVGDRQLVMRSSGGALGWGTPAAVGAKVGRPERPVVAVVGDGSFQFSVQAIWSSVEAGAPIVVVVLDNGGYLAVKRAIEGYVGLAHDRRHHPGTEIAGVDHLAVAKGYGADGVAVTKSSDLGPAVESGLAGERPFVVHVRVAQVRP